MTNFVLLGDESLGYKYTLGINTLPEYTSLKIDKVTLVLFIIHIKYFFSSEKSSSRVKKRQENTITFHKNAIFIKK